MPLITSRPCPSCRTTAQVQITETQAQRYDMGAYIQDVLPTHSRAVRERFISGFCPSCWDDTFGNDPDDVA